MAVGELERHVQAWVHGGRDVETTGLVIGRIRDLAAADRRTVQRWVVGELREDRKERSALLLGLARQLAYTRRRLRQASDDLDGLAARRGDLTGAVARSTL